MQSNNKGVVLMLKSLVERCVRTLVVLLKMLHISLVKFTKNFVRLSDVKFGEGDYYACVIGMVG
jgi:hypothetical protein